MDAIELLRRQHREVEAFFREFKMLNPESPRSRTAIFEMIADALAVHAKIEEQIFYPAAKFRKTEKLLKESVQEHLQVKRVIAELLEMDETDPQFAAKVEKLEQDVQHHVEEEEQQLFPMVRTQLGRIKLEQLGEQMEAMAKELEQEEPREMVPEETDRPAPI